MKDHRDFLVTAFKEGTFLEAVYTLSMESHDDRDDIPIEIAALHNDGVIDVVACFAALEEKSGADFFLTRHIFEKALPNLNAPIEPVMHCVLRLYRAAGHDMMAGTIVTSYVSYCAKDPLRPRAALEKIEADPDNFSDLLCPTIAAGSQIERAQDVTGGSVLYPTIALWAALLDADKIYHDVANLKNDYLQHCNFQLWFPDDSSERHFYTDDDSHGAVLTDVCVERTKNELLEQVFGECDASPQLKELSAVKLGWWPLILVACRQYRLPVPTHLLEGLRNSAHKGNAQTASTNST